MGFSPKHTKADRDMINFNGLVIPNIGVFVASGSIEGVVGSSTGSATLKFDALAVRLRRVEVFHSGSAPLFNIRLENSSPNTGSFFDPRSVITCYENVPGSPNYEGLDQIEDMVSLTDIASGFEGKLYLKVMPHGAAGSNTFKYLLFFEAVMLYVDRDPLNTRVPR